MSIYYVSNTGLDTNDGLSPETAWATIQKVNATIVGGDEVRFRRGDTFYGTIFPTRGKNENEPTVYRDYGEGHKPVITQMKKIKKEAWVQVSEKIWRVDLYDINNYTGNTSELDKNVGYMKVDGKLLYDKKFVMENLEKQWDFYCDDDNKKVPYMWLYSEKNPGELAESIEVACEIFGSCLEYDVQFVNLYFTGTGAHGIGFFGKRVLISGCEFHQIGGSRLVWYPSPDCRYGNGVEIGGWIDSSDIIVENCSFSEVYDVATTIQGRPETGWKNIHFRNNLIWNCNQAFEIWMEVADKEKDIGMVDCSFTDNVCINCGYGWGYDARPDKAQSGPLLFYHFQSDKLGMDITRNYFYNGRNCSLFKTGTLADMPKGYNVYGNTFVRKKGQHIALFYGDNIPETDAYEYDRLIEATNTVLDLPEFEPAE